MADVMKQLPKACMMVEELKPKPPVRPDWYNPFDVTDDDMEFI